MWVDPGEGIDFFPCSMVKLGERGGPVPQRFRRGWMIMSSKFLEGLNPGQAKAVCTLEGPVQINATAGSGKTRVLVNRIGYMLEQGIKPGNILCTTFTKKATEEMTDRLSTIIKPMHLKLLTLGTFHSIAYRILAKEYKEMGHKLAAVFDYRNRDGLLINGSLKRFGEDVKKDIMYDRSVHFAVKEALTDIALPQLLKMIGSSKNSYIDCHEYQVLNSGQGARMEAYVEFYLRYEQKRLRECRMDMDDMLFNLVRLFEDRPDLLAKYQRYYKYLLVDEAQDNNKLQYMLIRMIGNPEYNIFLVGDDDQSMYSFRGAVPEEFIDFTKNYRGAQKIALEDNYRSNPGILDVANKLIRHNTVRLEKTLKANKVGPMDCVNYSHYKNEDAEASSVVQEIKTLVDKEGEEPKGIAILYRTNAQSRAFEDNLIMAGLPYVIHGGISFYERKEVKDIIAYLELAVNQHNDEAFKRVVNVPSRYLGKAFMSKVESGRGSYYENCMSAAQKNYEINGIKDFKDKIDTIGDMLSQGLTPADLVNYVLEDSGVGYQKHFLDDMGDEEEEEAKMENIHTLRFILGRFENLVSFLDYIKMMTGEAKIDINGVQLMTIHKSKGLEFPTVFIAGSSEGMLPHFKSVEAEKEGRIQAIEEERRLMYVAVTRAEAKCYVSSIQHFNGKPQNPSRFLKEMGLSAKNTGDTPEDKETPKEEKQPEVAPAVKEVQPVKQVETPVKKKRELDMASMQAALQRLRGGGR